MLELLPFTRAEIRRIMLLGGLVIAVGGGGALMVGHFGVPTEMAYVAGFLSYVLLDGFAAMLGSTSPGPTGGEA